MDAYREIPGVNWSALKHLDVSPKEYQYRLAHPRPDTPALRLGRAVHCAVYEPDGPRGQHLRLISPAPARDLLRARGHLPTERS